jgi:hypothetical protein
VAAICARVSQRLTTLGLEGIRMEGNKIEIPNQLREPAWAAAFAGR